MMVALLAYLLFGSALWAWVAGLLMAVEGLSFVMSRTGLLDSFVAFWVTAGFLSWCWIGGGSIGGRTRRRGACRPRAGLATPTDRGCGRAGSRARCPPPPPRVPSPIWRPWRFAAGLAMGAAIATKWSGRDGARRGRPVALAWETAPPRRRGRPAAGRWGGRSPGSRSAWCWRSWSCRRSCTSPRTSPGSTTSGGAWARGCDNQRDMWDYHKHLEWFRTDAATARRHAQPSVALARLVVAADPAARPVLRADTPPTGRAGSPRSATRRCSGARSGRCRTRPSPGGAAATGAPPDRGGLRGCSTSRGSSVSRPQFFFYMTPMVPFLVLAAVYTARDLSDMRIQQRDPRTGEVVGRSTLFPYRPIVWGYVAAAVAFFVFFYPVLTGTHSRRPPGSSGSGCRAGRSGTAATLGRGPPPPSSS